jgi:glycosyltransferase involved in cell wall biosynthesis
MDTGEWQGEGLRVLAVTRLFPNPIEPHACPFQRQQLAALARRAHVEVLGVIPHLPGASLLGKRAARVLRLRAVPPSDVVDGLPVTYPRVPYVPGAGKWLSGLNAPLYLAGLLPYLPALRGRFDVVLGAFLYPDACAAAALARILGVPYVVKAHGTDVNVLGRWPSVRAWARPALRGAGAVVGVSRPLVDALVRLGARPGRVRLVKNGVDRALFRPRDRAEARAALGLPAKGRIALYVGRLEPQKGLGELIEAFARVAQGGPQETRLVLVGDGAMRAELERKAARLGTVTLAGVRPPAEVAQFLGAADVLVLPSWAEGTPNVVLEALASGRPVIASRVGGIPDVVEEGRTGLLVPPRDVRALGEALRKAMSCAWSAEELIQGAPPSWEKSAEALHGALAHAAARRVAA